jgi:hypothetical protein
MRIRIGFFAVLLATAACGGGGGGGGTTTVPPSSGSATPAPSTTAPTPTPLSQNTAIQRTLVQQGLTSTSEASSIAQFAGGSGTTLGLVRRALENRRAIASVTSCQNGTTSSSTMVSSTVENLTINDYYDAGCVTLESVGQFVLTATSTSAATATGSFTYYTTAGTVYEYVNPVTIALGGIGTSSETVSIGETLATNTTSAPYGSFGVGCSLTTASESCSLAAVDHLAATHLDQGASANVTASVSGTTQTTVALSGSGAGYSSTLDALSVVAQGSFSWAVSGAAPLVSANLNGSVMFANGGTLVAETLSVSDSADAVAVAMSYSATNQTIAGTLTPTAGGAPVATFSVSTTGTGTVTYGNGTTAQIVNWVVQA